MSGCQGYVLQQYFLAWEQEVCLRNDFITVHWHKAKLSLAVSIQMDGWGELRPDNVSGKISTFIKLILPLNVTILTVLHLYPQLWGGQNSSEDDWLKMCMNMQFSLYCQACKILRRFFLAWIFTNPEGPLTIAVTFEIGDRGVLATLVQKGQRGHPGAMNNSIFCTITIKNLSSTREEFYYPPSQAGDAAGVGEVYFGFFHLFSNLNWNEDMIIIINSSRKCMGRSSAEGFYSSQNRKLARALLSYWKCSVWVLLIVCSGCIFPTSDCKAQIINLSEYFCHLAYMCIHQSTYGLPGIVD